MECVHCKICACLPTSIWGPVQTMVHSNFSSKLRTTNLSMSTRGKKTRACHTRVNTVDTVSEAHRDWERLLSLIMITIHVFFSPLFLQLSRVTHSLIDPPVDSTLHNRWLHRLQKLQQIHDVPVSRDTINSILSHMTHRSALWTLDLVMTVAVPVEL